MTGAVQQKITAEDIAARLGVLEDEKQVRLCMQKYMRLCDDIGVGFDIAELAALFTEDAIWEGVGTRYAKTFGRKQGRAAITDMFATYTRPPGHFTFNLHFLGNDEIYIDGDRAQGTWLMLQPASYISGESQLSCARIRAQFRREGTDATADKNGKTQGKDKDIDADAATGRDMGKNNGIGQRGQWRICLFQTENLFTRPVSTWVSDTVFSVPEEQEKADTTKT